MQLAEIEALAGVFASHRAQLAGRVEALEAIVRDAKRRALPGLRDAVTRTADAKIALAEALSEHPELFEKPKTRMLAGVRVGYMKQRGKVEITDEGKVIDRIRNLLPADQAELLVRVRESVDKQAAADLTAADLRRLGISLTDDIDVMVIKPVDAKLDKLVDDLLAEATETEEAA